jgi:hypothetical protein
MKNNKKTTKGNNLKNKTQNLLKFFKKNRKINIYTIIVCIAVIMIWRAIWNFCDLYIFPNHQILSNMLCLTIWIIILLIDDWKLKELL